MFMRLASACLLAGMSAGLTAPEHSEVNLSGAYDVTYSLELPHLERWAIAKTARVRLCDGVDAERMIVPIFSPNTPFSACRVRNLRRDGVSLVYDILCEGRDAARARAMYTVTADGFEGRVTMVLGAKNMTMTEVQTGRRVGGCDLANAHNR